MQPHIPMKERIESKYIPEPNTGCWLWIGATRKSGRDQHLRSRLMVGGRSKLAHRLSYEAYVGPIPEGLFVCHRCDTPLCVNPGHLFVGTHTDNMRDMMRKGRYRGGFPATHSRGKGAEHPRAKLTQAQVDSIRTIFQAERLCDLAKKFGVSPRTIYAVRNGRSWGSSLAKREVSP